MWIPTPLYERAPAYWLWVGLFLIVVGIYLGIEVASWYLYLGLITGGASVAWGIRTYWQRSAKREQAKATTENA